MGGGEEDRRDKSRGDRSSLRFAVFAGSLTADMFVSVSNEGGWVTVFRICVRRWTKMNLEDPNRQRDWNQILLRTDENT